MNPIIEVQNLSKLYQIGAKEAYGSLRDEIMQTIAAPFRCSKPSSTSDDNTLWALKDVSFEVNEGEVVGIIGRNGAGKSTLLKILSRITEPTSGKIKMRGRVASLLEVGTGFHPELTGRENIFLNGSLLGMTNAEIRRKFDEIVAFSEIEKFLDTPVKRYSSGMYVRLAFAVAAHLEPEILVVDEVLAVGDAQFQKKCMGKMGAVAKGGRTVLFVSHNMTAIQTLCKKAICLNQGMVVCLGDAQRVINEYIGKRHNIASEKTWTSDGAAPGNQNIRLHAIRVLPEGVQSGFTIKIPLRLEFDYSLYIDDVLFYVGLHVRTITGQCACVTTSNPEVLRSGRYVSVCHIPGDLLNAELYTLHVYYVRDGSNVLLEIENPVFFEIHDVERAEGAWIGAIPGAVRPLLKWDINRRENV